MNTPALIAELLVGGALCLIWMCFLLRGLVDIRPLLTLAKDDPLIAAACFSAVAYALGVVFDRVWGRCLRPLTKKIERSRFASESALRLARQQVFGEKKIGADYVVPIRSRLRVARAFFCNSICFLFAAGVSILLGQVKFADIQMLILLAGTFAGIAFFAFRHLTVDYFDALKMLTEAPNQPPEPTPPPVRPDSEQH